MHLCLLKIYYSTKILDLDGKKQGRIKPLHLLQAFEFRARNVRKNSECIKHVSLELQKVVCCKFRVWNIDVELFKFNCFLN